MRVRPRVLMVTGAYYPELSGGGLQARALVHALRGEADFCVLTTSTDRSLPSRAEEDGIPIRRIYVDTTSRASQGLGAAQFAAALLSFMPRIDIVNLHGFSRKAIMLARLTRALGKKFVVTLQTGGHDEPAAARALGPAAFRAYANADLYFSVSPGLSAAYLAAGLAADRLRQVCNAVDTNRFAPASCSERRALRAELGLPEMPLVLFVGFFSREKRPELLYRAWSRVATRVPSTVVFVGATAGSYLEVDPALADEIRRRTAVDALADRVVLVGITRSVERYFRAADIYVLPSVREGLSISLLEAMSTGLACVASRLPGSTDAVIEDGVNGLLVAPDDEEGFGRAIGSLLADRAKASRLGAAARQTILDRYSIHNTARAWLAGYRELLAAG
jgi:glycosyltransferase involved in cell wall biosynthesis